MLNELFFEATPVILNEDDLNSMYNSVENRSPFLDSRLAEFAYTIPSKHLIHDGYNKFILREAVNGILNTTVRLDRRKKGFNASINSLFAFENSNISERLLNKSSKIFEILKWDKIVHLLNKKVIRTQKVSFSLILLTHKCSWIIVE